MKALKIFHRVLNHVLDAKDRLTRRLPCLLIDSVADETGILAEEDSITDVLLSMNEPFDTAVSSAMDIIEFQNDAVELETGMTDGSKDSQTVSGQSSCSEKSFADPEKFWATCLLLGDADKKDIGSMLENDNEMADFLKLAAARFIEIAAGRPGEEIPRALRGVTRLGIARDRETENFSLPGLSVSILISYFSLHCNRKVVRQGINLVYYLLPDENSSVESMLELFSCGKERFHKGRKELLESGLLSKEEPPNAPGAGRPPISDDFKQVMSPVCQTAGLNEEALKQRNLQTQLSEAEANIKASLEDTQNSLEKDACSGTDLTKSENEAEKMVSTFVMKVEADAQSALERFGQELKHARTGPIIKLSAVFSAFQDAVLWLKELNQQLLDDSTGIGTSEECRTDHRAPSDSDENCEMHESVPFNFTVCLAFRLRQVCDTMNRALEDAGDNPYRIMKELNRYAVIRNLCREVEAFKIQYSWIQDLKKRISDQQTVVPAQHIESQDPYEIVLPPVCFQDASSGLEDLIRRFTDGAKRMNQKAALMETLTSAIEELNILKKILRDLEENPSSEEGYLYDLSVLVRTISAAVKRWQKTWDQHGNERIAIQKTASAILSSREKELIIMLYSKCVSYQEAEDPAVGESDSSSATDKEQIDHSDMDHLLIELEGQEKENPPELREETDCLSKKVMEKIMALSDLLDKGKISKRNGGEANEKVAEAMLQLGLLSTKFKEMAEDAFESKNTITAYHALKRTAEELLTLLERWLSKFVNNDSKTVSSYTTAKQIATSICRPRNKTKMDTILEEYKRRCSCTAPSVQTGTAIPDNYREIELEDDWFTSPGYMPTKKRLQTIMQMWNEGKDPLDITVWIEYIMRVEYARTYGDPCNENICCRITRKELANAFRYLTGITYSDTALWNILTKKMGYSGHQCEKLEQIGDSHPLRDTQFKIIDHMVAAAEMDPRKTLIIYIDTKAFVNLGRFKADNALLMKERNGKAYRTLDHDYILKIRDIYPDGTDLVDESRMDEPACLHPQGVYCPQDSTAYVSLTLGKDTAESMASLISTVIKLKKADMPELTSVLILADGGGSNTANGITWSLELLRVCDETGMKIMMCHFPPGTSKHSLIEHRLWGPISKHWKGRPKLDIEHVMRYIQTTTNIGRDKRKLKVRCWFDGKRYKTNVQKKADGEITMTRKQFEAETQGRIIHPYDKGTDLFKWNYILLPSEEIIICTGR